MYSGEEIRMQAVGDINVKTAANVRGNAGGSWFLQTTADVHIKSGAAVNIESTSALHLKSGSTVNINSAETMNLLSSAEARMSGTDVHINASGSIFETGSQIHLNGPSAATATSASPATAAAEKPALWTNRVPDHEPWARTMTKNDTTHDPELSYGDKRVGRIERGTEIERGKFWRR
jgi:hypothetical protein